ncbi:MAG: hypothetical protein ACI8UR_002177 [Natronomonas sp.]|jgi:hypothetical protein|uniref:DUF7139 domain-containing protein n=1 Tax=Natronomonas sp. TaxID=2184060 RepID=UPI003989B868
MASLTEVYQGGNGTGLRRLYAGVALFGVGSVVLVAGIAIAATELGQLFGLGLFEARRVAGVLGGLGLPALLIGTMTVLPRAQRTVRVAAAAGALVCVVGVVLFQSAYPVDWVGGSGNANMTLVVTGVYFTGAIVTCWCLFASVANFKARNDPGGTVTLEITKGGETKIVEVSDDDLRGRLGGIGLLGSTPDGDVETQTNRNAGSGQSRQTTQQAPQNTSVDASPGVTDGGSTSASLNTPGTQTSSPQTTDDAEFLDDEPATPAGDTYCGNCAHFRYVRTDDGMVPYCGLNSEPMDDMDACEEWTPNN